MGGNKARRTTRREEARRIGREVLEVGRGSQSADIPIDQFNFLASKLGLCKAGSMYTEIEKSHQLYLSYYGKDIYNGLRKQTLMPWYCFKIEKI